MQLAGCAEQPDELLLREALLIEHPLSPAPAAWPLWEGPAAVVVAPSAAAVSPVFLCGNGKGKDASVLDAGCILSESNRRSKMAIAMVAACFRGMIAMQSLCE
jgi:hypothetical protein